MRATLRIVHTDLERHFSLSAPRIAVLGLNPHAGESGHLGREEIEVIEPVIRQLRTEGCDVRGPIPADTAFTPQFLATADVVVAMYHDQGLPVIKHVGFGNAVNVTLGLPILRTSVDHGTALSLARTGRADSGSLRAALALAIDLASAGRSMAVRKRFGQHFLHDPGVIRRIIDAVAPASGERIVEVGPGRGALTWSLLERAGELDVIEIDRDLARSLQADSRAQAHLRVHVENVLDTDFVRLRADGPPLRIVGNLPYNISTPLLFHLLRSARRDSRHAFHVTKGGRGSNGGGARRKGIWPLDRDARRLRAGGGSVRRGSGGVSAATEGMVRRRALAAEPAAALRHRQRRRAASLGHRRFLPPPQDAAQRLEGPVDR